MNWQRGLAVKISSIFVAYLLYLQAYNQLTFPHRGLWIRAISVVSPDSIPRIIKIIEDLDITDIYVQMVVGGSSYYNSYLLPRSEYLARHSPPEYSPVDTLLEYCKKRGVKFHAWINAFTVWSFYKRPDSIDHIFYKNPGWFLKDIFGRSMVDYSGYEWTDLGLEGLFINPEELGVRDFIKEILLEVIERYPVDGLHLDFFRYPGIYWGIGDSLKTSIFAITEAREIRWLTLTRYPQLSLFKRWLTYNFYKLNRRREENLYHLARTLYETIKRKRDIKVSYAVISNPARARYQYAQTWWNWEGAYDYCVVMSYTPDLSLFEDFLEFTYLYQPGAIMGIGLLWPVMKDVAGYEQSLISQKGGRGFSLFDFAAIDTMFDGGELKRSLSIKPEGLPRDTGVVSIITDLFQERPPKIFVDSGEILTRWDMDLDFFHFLLSLSLNPGRDLKRMGMNREGLLELIHDDVCAFEYINKKVFADLSLLIEPPAAEIAYEFFPYQENDTSLAIRSAENTKKLTERRVVYPAAMDPLSEEVFKAKRGERKIAVRRSGVYLYTVRKIKEGGRTLVAKRIKPELLVLYYSWTIKNRFFKIIEEAYGEDK